MRELDQIFDTLIGHSHNLSAYDFDGVKNVLIEVRYQNKGIAYE